MDRRPSSVHGDRRATVDGETTDIARARSTRARGARARTQTARHGSTPTARVEAAAPIRRLFGCVCVCVYSVCVQCVQCVQCVHEKVPILGLILESYLVHVYHES